MADKSRSKTNPSVTKPQNADSKTKPASGDLQIAVSKTKPHNIAQAQLDSKSRPSTGPQIADSNTKISNAGAQKLDSKTTLPQIDDSKMKPSSGEAQNVESRARPPSMVAQKADSKINTQSIEESNTHSKTKVASVVEQEVDGHTEIASDQYKKSDRLTNPISTESQNASKENFISKESQKIDSKTKPLSAQSEKVDSKSKIGSKSKVSLPEVVSSTNMSSNNAKYVAIQSQEKHPTIKVKKEASSTKRSSTESQKAQVTPQASTREGEMKHFSRLSTASQKVADSKQMHLSETAAKCSSIPSSVLKKMQSTDSQGDENQTSKSMYTIKDSSEKPSSILSSMQIDRREKSKADSIVKVESKESKFLSTDTQKRSSRSRTASTKLPQDGSILTFRTSGASLHEYSETKLQKERSRFKSQKGGSRSQSQKEESGSELRKGDSGSKSQKERSESKSHEERSRTKSWSTLSERDRSISNSRSEYSRSKSKLKESRTNTPSTFTEKDAQLKSSITVQEKPYEIINIPIQYTRMSIFGDEYCKMREKFLFELRRMEEEIELFSTTLKRWYGRTKSMSMLRIPSDNTMYRLCPHIQDTEGTERALKLTFDVSHFDPSEVSVSIVNKKTLVIAAKHEEETDGRIVFREYKRELLVPRSTVPESIISCHFRDGILTIEAPFYYPRQDSFLSVPSLEPSVCTYISSLGSSQKEGSETSSDQKEAQGSVVISCSQREVASCDAHKKVECPEVYSGSQKEVAVSEVVGTDQKDVTEPEAIGSSEGEILGSTAVSGKEKEDSESGKKGGEPILDSKTSMIMASKANNDEQRAISDSKRSSQQKQVSGSKESKKGSGQPGQGSQVTKNNVSSATAKLEEGTRSTVISEPQQKAIDSKSGRVEQEEGSQFSSSQVKEISHYQEKESSGPEALKEGNSIPPSSQKLDNRREEISGADPVSGTEKEVTSSVSALKQGSTATSHTMLLATGYVQEATARLAALAEASGQKEGPANATVQKQTSSAVSSAKNIFSVRSGQKPGSVIATTISGQKDGSAVATSVSNQKQDTAVDPTINDGKLGGIVTVTPSQKEETAVATTAGEKEGDVASVVSKQEEGIAFSTVVDGQLEEATVPAEDDGQVEEVAASSVVDGQIEAAAVATTSGKPERPVENPSEQKE